MLDSLTKFLFLLKLFGKKIKIKSKPVNFTSIIHCTKKLVKLFCQHKRPRKQKLIHLLDPSFQFISFLLAFKYQTINKPVSKFYSIMLLLLLFFISKNSLKIKITRGTSHSTQAVYQGTSPKNTTNMKNP